MNLKNSLIFLCIIFGFASTATAQDSDSGLFIEPSITYEMGETTVTYPSPLSNSTGESDGFGLGARLGFHVAEAFFLGLDGRYSMPQFKDSSVSYDAKAVSTNWAPVVGMQMPDIGLRVWAAWIVGGELNPEKSGNIDIRFKDASGYRVGAGFRVKMFSLNLEYQQLKYGDAVLEQFGPFDSNTSFSSVELENQSWIASVSFPLEL